MICGAGRCRWKDVDRAQTHPSEFRDDVMAVARRGDAPIGSGCEGFGLVPVSPARGRHAGVKIQVGSRRRRCLFGTGAR